MCSAERPTDLQQSLMSSFFEILQKKFNRQYYIHLKNKWIILILIKQRENKVRKEPSVGGMLVNESQEDNNSNAILN